MKITRMNPAELSVWILSLALSGAVAPAWSQDRIPPTGTVGPSVESLRQVRVSAEGVVYVTPDTVTLSLGVTSSSSELDKVKSDLDTRSTKLVQALKAVGVPDDQIQTAQADISINYQDWQRRTGREFVGSRNYTVKLKDLSMLAKVMNAAFENGANTMGGVNYTSSEMPKFQDEARKQAVRSAKEKAALLASELGAKTGRVLTITENSDVVFPLARGYAAAMAAAPAPGGTTEESLPAGRIAVRANVTVSFELTD